MIVFFDAHPTPTQKYIFTDCMTGDTAVRTILRTGEKSVYSDVFNRHELRYWVEMADETGEIIASEYELTK